MNPFLKVLVIGSGGREHALLRACQASPLVSGLHAAPGNTGMAEIAECHPLEAEDPAACVELAGKLACNLVIVGPEAPLAAGVADALRAAGIATYGPGRKGAELEASKAACKQFFDRYGIPTAAWRSFTEVAPALTYLETCRLPVVVKASGLAAGKGVLICGALDEARQAVRGMLEENRFGDSGKEIVIEECLAGEEASIMVMVSGDRYVCLPASQDHKRIGEGDTGPNTGGMGAYAPAAVVDEAVMQQVRTRIIEPTLEGFRKEGIDYRGTLFVGLMIDENGKSRVLEYNVRFGDPECQVLLPLCETDPVQLMWDCAQGTLEPGAIRFREASSLIVVLAARGYPGAYAKGDPITLPDALPEGVHLIHAGTGRDGNGQLVGTGGRVLGVVAVRPRLEEAAQAAYSVCDAIQWENKYFRRDIAYRQLKS